MRRILVGMAVIAASLFMPATTSGAVANCPGGQIGPGATVHDDVVVAGGTTCVIVESTVNGSVQVQPGGSLDLVRTGVTGSVAATRPADLDIEGGTIGTSLSIDGSSPGGDGLFAICGTDVGGSVSIQNVADSGVALGDAGECPEGMTVDIGGSLSIVNNSGDIDVGGDESDHLGARNKIAGSLNVAGNTRDVDIDHSDFGGAGNVVNNTTTEEVTLEGNTFGRPLYCHNNSPAPVGADNSAPALVGQCAGLDAPPA